jgi:hypothetical protein
MLAIDMGVLIRRATGDRRSLWSRFVAGRSPASQLRLDSRLASAIHAELLWTGSGWELHDLGSRNGTFVDGRRLEPGTRATLRRGARIAFGDAEDPFELVDDGPPCAVAVSDGGQRQESEAGILLLPGPERPMCTIFEEGGGNWMVESNDGARHRIASGDTLRVAEHTWRIELPMMPEHTWQPEAGQVALRDATMRCTLRGDQEIVDIRLIHGDRVIPLPARSYRHLLLALARARLVESAAGAAEADAGWMPLATLLEVLQMSESTFNVHVARARKDLARAGVVGATDLVERQPTPRRLRLGVRTVEIVQT